MNLLNSNKFSLFIVTVKNYPVLYTSSANPKEQQCAYEEIGNSLNISPLAVERLWWQIVCWHRRMLPNEDDTRFLLQAPKLPSNDPWNEADDRMAESLSHFFIDELNFLLK